VATRKKAVDFEENLSRLEDLVDALESGDLSLEESLKAFENGIKMTRECQSALKQAEQRVEVLTRTGDGKMETAPFDDLASE
jgi:exodeoxyribonuclease VII small subunit